ncbi:hypothetical protein ES703_21786 [subsurface metagenome]
MLKWFLIICGALGVIAAIWLGVYVVQTLEVPVTFAMLIALAVILVFVFLGLGAASLIKKYKENRR